MTSLRAWCFAAGALALLGCTDRPIARITDVPPPPFDNKLELTGNVCTADPADLEFPVKVLFVIDTSQSMNVSDPVRDAPDPLLGETTVVDPTQSTGRSRAIKDVIGQFIDLGIQYPPVYCNTGDPDCAKGSTVCPACLSAAPAMCIGPDCCQSEPCSGVPHCPSTSMTNGVCLPLCDATKTGCGPGETGCPDCPSAGDRCTNGICARTRDPGVKFAIMRFGSAKQVLTRTPDGQPGFTNDPSELVTALPQVNNGGSVTDYEGALNEAFQLLSADMSAARKNNSAAINRTKYVVIFLSDGQPDPRVNGSDDWQGIPQDLRADLLGDQAQYYDTVGQYNVQSGILRRVKEIMELKALYRIGDIKLHTAYLTGPNTPPYLQDQAIGLLKQMSQVGDGTFRNFRNGEEINFLHVDFSSLRRVFRLKSLIVSNANARPALTTTVTDSDGDALSDTVEVTAGTRPDLLDTDHDGFSDTLEYFFRSSGADPLDPTDADCNLIASDLDGNGIPDDTDGDGLFDCEERFLGTSKDLFDTDADGIPDGLEVRFGTNPVADDTLDDLDFDGMPNGDEIRLHTDPRADDAAHRSVISYRYDVQRTGTGVETMPVTCKDDTDCAQGTGCVDGYCTCVDANACSTLASCTGDGECTRAGERCVQGRCASDQTCEQNLQDVPANQQVCAMKRYITCYDYDVQNITLVSPTSLGEPDWNTIYLYFGQVPFDNPKDFGIFSMSCVRARYDDENGAKLPAKGALRLKRSDWKDPRQFDPATDCVCPDGEHGTCPPPP